MNKENKLGMGLGALLSTPNRKNDNNNIQKINISQIIPNPSQPRKNFRDAELKQLSLSIKNQGLIQPIIVKPLTDNQFQIIAGERRWRACQLNGIHEVDCVIRDLEDVNVLEAALIENIQREDLNVIEEANAYKGLVDIKGINNEKLAKLIGKSSSHVSNLLRLLDLDKKIQEMLINGDLSMGHARALIGVPDAVNKANEIIEKKLSVRQVEKITSKFKKNKPNKSTKDPNIVDLEKELSDKIGLKTSIQFSESGSSGSLTLYYSDLNQLDDLMKRLKK
tara:strand:- start:2937 stop:3773 length:837 start_codon:yes stop_codon:yes gene_type:complete